MSQTININNQIIEIDVQDIEPVLSVNNNPVEIMVDSGGAVAANDNVTLTAGVNISALRAITTNTNGDAVYASNDTLANAQVVGVSSNSANTGEAVTIQMSGIMTDQSWNWVKGTVFLGANGTLTQTPPTPGAVLVHIGRALTATKLLIDTDTIIQTV